MSQVTRCPACGTRFKVVADQLRISQGGCAAASAMKCSMPPRICSPCRPRLRMPPAIPWRAGHRSMGRNSRTMTSANSGSPCGCRRRPWGCRGGCSGTGCSHGNCCKHGACCQGRAFACRAACRSCGSAGARVHVHVHGTACADPFGFCRRRSGRELPGASLVDEILAASVAAPAAQPQPDARHGPAVASPPSLEPEPEPEPQPEPEHKPVSAPSPHKVDGAVPSQKADAPSLSVPTGLVRESERQAQVSVPSPEFSRWPDSDGEVAATTSLRCPRPSPALCVRRGARPSGAGLPYAWPLCWAACWARALWQAR